MKIAILGTGAIGGFYGGLLARYGHNVHFLLNSDYGYVSINGLNIDSPDESFTLSKVNAWKNSADIPACDLIVVCLKTTANHLLQEILAPMLSNTPNILTLQNGLGSESTIHKIAPNCRIFGGLCSVAVNKISPGHIKHISYNSIRMGEYLAKDQPAGITNALQEIAAAFEISDIHIDLSHDIIEARWRKLCWNIPFNGLTTLHDQDTSKIISNPKTRTQAIDIIAEVISTANSIGKNIEDSFLNKMISLTENMAPYKPSMLLDHQAKRQLEVEAIYKNALDTAHNHDLKMPLTQKLYESLVALENHEDKNKKNNTPSTTSFTPK